MKGKRIMAIGIFVLFIGIAVIPTSTSLTNSNNISSSDRPPDWVKLLFAAEIEGNISLDGGTHHNNFNSRLLPCFKINDGKIKSLILPWSIEIPNPDIYNVRVTGLFAKWNIFDDNEDETYYVEGRVFLVEVLYRLL